MGDNRKLGSLRHIFKVLYPLSVVESLNTEGASLFVHSYHWLPLATIDLVGDNRELESLRHIMRFSG